MLEAERVGVSGVTKRVWRFSIHDTNIFLTGYKELARESKRHGWKVVSWWEVGRSGYSGDSDGKWKQLEDIEIPLTVEAEIKHKVFTKLRVVKPG